MSHTGHLDRLAVAPGGPADLAERDPRDTGGFRDKAHAHTHLVDDAKAIAMLQARLHAEGTRALLVILQGMDTSGKDGTIRAVFGRTSPLGIHVTSFARPSAEELGHDFLWRVHKACPRRGSVGVFNRSHYEDVLAARVRGTVAAETIEHRFRQINDFEALIASSTVVLKIMLHISRDEQRERLQSRLDTPHKRWKFDPGDLDDRKLWPDYMKAYADVLGRCSTELAPWFVVPADRKWARNAIVAALVRRTLERMDPRYPTVEWDPASFTVAP